MIMNARRSLSPHQPLNTLCNNTTPNRSSSSPSSSNNMMAQHERIRLEMQSRLLTMVQSKFPTSPNKNKATVAKALDQLLFRAAPSFEDYSDLTTLDSRIRNVVTKKLQQKNKPSTNPKCKKQSLQAMKKTARKQTLQDVLGQDYQVAQDLVRDIKLAKNRKVATFKCFGGVCVRQSPSFHGDFPKEIKALFFGTALVDAFELAPVNKLASLNWKHMIQVAQTNLNAYKASPHCVQE